MRSGLKSVESAGDDMMAVDMCLFSLEKGEGRREK